MGRWNEEGSLIPTTLFEAAAFHYSIKARCPDCQHEAVFHGAALWWLCHRKHWSERLVDFAMQMRCTRCKRRGAPIKAVKAEPTITNLPLPDKAEWKRAVSRFRS